MLSVYGTEQPSRWVNHRVLSVISANAEIQKRRDVARSRITPVPGSERQRVLFTLGRALILLFRGERSPTFTLWSMPKKENRRRGGYHDAENEAAGLRQQRQSTLSPVGDFVRLCDCRVPGRWVVDLAGQMCGNERSQLCGMGPPS